MVQPGHSLRKLNIDHLPINIVVDHPPPRLLPVSFVRAFSGVNVKSVPYTQSGRRSSPGVKQCRPSTRCNPRVRYLFLQLQKVSPGATKETLRIALRVLPVGPNTIKAEVANHEYHDEEHESITSVSLFLVGIWLHGRGGTITYTLLYNGFVAGIRALLGLWTNLTATVFRLD